MTTVLFVGDSITVGLVGYAQGKTKGSSFRARAAQALGWTAVGPFEDPNKLKHGGVGGYTTWNFIHGNAQFVKNSTGESAPTWVRTYKPDVIHIMLGDNDIMSYDEPVKDLLDRLKGLAADAVWQQKEIGKRGNVLISTVCESLLPKQVERARVLNSNIRHIKEIGKDYSILGVDSAGNSNKDANEGLAHNFNEAIVGLSKYTLQPNISKYTVDGTHPNQLGYDLIADSLVNSVAPRQSTQTSGPSAGAKLFAAGAIGVGGWAVGRALKWW